MRRVTAKLPKPPRGFRHVLRYRGWAVDRRGVVVSCKRFGHGNTWGAWHRLKLQKKRAGGPTKPAYMFVGLRTPRFVTKVRVHRLVLLAFVGPCPRRKEGCHKNGKSTDNRLRNLRWGSPLSNSADQRRHGTGARGESHGGAKLTDRAVQQILESRERVTRLAVKYGVSASLISMVRLRQRWKHIKRRSRR